MTNSANLKRVALLAPPAPAAPSIRVHAPLGDTGYRANPDAFAAQMAIFGRMRETEHAFRQRAKRNRL
jgi:hypothetical protein